MLDKAHQGKRRFGMAQGLIGFLLGGGFEDGITEPSGGEKDVLLDGFEQRVFKGLFREVVENEEVAITQIVTGIDKGRGRVFADEGVF